MEFLSRPEQLLPAACARVNAFALIVGVLAGERLLCSLLPQYVILLGGELLLPFLV